MRESVATPIPPFLRTLMPEATDAELASAAENLRAYLVLALRAYLRVYNNDPVVFDAEMVRRWVNTPREIRLEDFPRPPSIEDAPPYYGA